MLMSAARNFVPEPALDCEVFVHRIPQCVSEQELRSMFEKYGDIFSLRLVAKTSSKGNNYAFVRFTERTAVRDAVLRWNGYEIRRGLRISVCKSIVNRYLALCGIPRHLHPKDVFCAVNIFASGLEGVYVHKSRDNRGINSGIAILSYSTHDYATTAKKILTDIRKSLWNRPFYVSWYVPGLEWEDFLPPAIVPGFSPGFYGVIGTGVEFGWNYLVYSSFDFACETLAYAEYEEFIYSWFEDRQ